MKDIIRLKELGNELFDLANSHAGNDKGNAALYLHRAANEINRAIKSLEAGNKADEPIPMSAILSSMGFGRD